MKLSSIFLSQWQFLFDIELTLRIAFYRWKAKLVHIASVPLLEFTIFVSHTHSILYFHFDESSTEKQELFYYIYIRLSLLLWKVSTVKREVY